MSRLESRSIASMASNVNINRLSNTGVDLRPRGMGNDVAGGQRTTSSAVVAAEAVCTQNEETKAALKMAAKLHGHHDSRGGGGVGSEMTNQLLTNHRECNC